MKKNLTASITINLLLAGFVLWLLRPGHAVEKPSVAPAAALDPGPRENQTPPSPAREIISPIPPFRWTQLESTNYHTYIANLRGIGCPEQTIRDIITADVDEAFYVARRAAVKQQLTGQSLENSLEEMAGQETALVTTLLGGSMVAAATTAGSSPAPSKSAFKIPSARSLETTAAQPLVLQPADLTAMKLNDTQIQIIGELRQTFMEKIGTSQDPNDPAYLQRWQAAQREADNMLAGMLGRNFVSSYQKELENQAAQPK